MSSPPARPSPEPVTARQARRPARVSALVTRRGLGPKIQLGTVGLNLPPNSEHAETEERKDEQFLHVDPSTSANYLTCPDRAAPGALGCQQPSKPAATIGPREPSAQRVRVTRASVHTGSSASYTDALPPKTRKRSNDRAEHGDSHVQVVVGLVKQQNLVRAAQQCLEHEALPLAARQRRRVAPAAPFVRNAERGRAAGIPQHLGL